MLIIVEGLIDNSCTALQKALLVLLEQEHYDLNDLFEDLPEKKEESSRSLNSIDSLAVLNSKKTHLKKDNKKLEDVTENAVEGSDGEGKNEVCTDFSIEYGNLTSPFSVLYGLQEAQFQAIYGTGEKPVAYDLGTTKKGTLNSIYSLENERGTCVAWDTDSETLATEEAEKVISETMYRAVLGGLTEMNFDERRKLSNWEKYNKSLLILFKNTSIIQTQEVNFTIRY